jgi:hypothetical protein
MEQHRSPVRLSNTISLTSCHSLLRERPGAATDNRGLDARLKEIEAFVLSGLEDIQKNSVVSFRERRQNW